MLDKYKKSPGVGRQSRIPELGYSFDHCITAVITATWYMGGTTEGFPIEQHIPISKMLKNLRGILAIPSSVF
ncbi:MAG: hypothetical protein FIO03_05365 [Nitrosopumilales archaeon]|nr:hypothetical protein [Nitrosopumilales archaeon]